MKTILHAYLMCRSMFCAIPSPQVWDEKAKDKMLLFLPLVGAEIGLIWWLIALLCGLLKLPSLLTGLILAIYPCLVTGGMHLDGFMDVTDAVSSWRDLSRRREILKDSHVGSFAVIGVVVVLLGQFACCAAFSPEMGTEIFVWIPVVSRFCSALAVTALKPMSTSQYADRSRSVPRLVGLSVSLVAVMGLGFWCCGVYALALPAGIVGYGLALRRAYRSLDGMNGDIAGYALTIGELCMIGSCVLLQTWLPG